MTLSVIAYLRNDDSSTTDLIEIGSPESLAGPESFRISFYGSVEMRSLGATLLPLLAQSNLWVEYDQLNQLEREVQIALAHFQTQDHSGTYIHRLQNISAAIELAKAQNGSVHIG